MRTALFLLSPLLLLGGCATPGMGPHAQRGQGPSMATCPMASPPAAGDQHHGGTGEQGGQDQARMMQGMHMGASANCPMIQDAAPATPQPSPDPHQH
jgi:hypothetical protein